MSMLWNLYLYLVQDFSLVPKPSTVPKTPPSTPVVTRNTAEEEEKHPEPVIKPNESNNQQRVKEPITTAGEREFDDFPDEETKSEFINFFYTFERYFIFIQKKFFYG
jgi:hypothetical protein